MSQQELGLPRAGGAATQSRDPLPGMHGSLAGAVGWHTGEWKDHGVEAFLESTVAFLSMSK